MTTRRFLSLGIASSAVLAAAPALAQPEMTYEPGSYEYARPAPVQAPVIFEQQPVVQPLPAPPAGFPVEDRPDEDRAGADYAADDALPGHAGHPRHHHHQGHHPVPTAGPYPAAPALPGWHHMGQLPPQPAAFDREAWLEDCARQYRSGRSDRREGGIGGGILGAAVGGVIGNRVVDGDRLAGTLIGAGIGGIAGAVIGSAIAGGGERERDRLREECEAWLDRYMAGGYGAGGYGAGGYGAGYYGHGYGYGYGHAVHMTYVPVLVQIPQRAVVRETVTEEWVETPHHHTRPGKRQVHRHAPAPRPAKGKVRSIK